MSAPTPSLLVNYDQTTEKEEARVAKPPVLLNSSEKEDGTMPWWGWLLIVLGVLALIGAGVRTTMKMQGGGNVSSAPAIRVIEPNVDSVVSDLTSF